MANVNWDDFSPVEDDPVSSIHRAANDVGIDPSYLVGLAKLETQLGERSIRGGGEDTRNLFNVKDFSGGGIRALDKAEGSNDAYRRYASYDDSTSDVVKLLERRYPDALKAKTPEEFANALKKGGYATDPDYVKKLTSVISSSKPSVNWDDFTPVKQSSSIIDSSFKQVEKPSMADRVKNFYSKNKPTLSTDDVSYDAAGNVQGITSKDDETKDGRAVDERRTRGDGRILDKDIPDATLKSIGQDVWAGVGQIIPTALKGVGDLTRMATGDRFGKGLSDFAESENKSLQERFQSERGKLQSQRFAQDMQDPAIGPADLIFGNKGALSDQLLPTVGSMALPIGAASAAGKLAQTGNAAKLAMAIDAETVLARANAAREAAAIGTTVAQNASGTYSDIRDKGGSQGSAYLGAVPAGLATLVAGKLTGGGAEAQASKLLSGGRATLKATPKMAIREGGQEGGEDLGAYIGETIGTGGEFDTNTALKRGAVAVTLGTVMGGGVNAAGAASQMARDYVPKSTPADIVSPDVITVDQAIATAQDSLASKPVAETVRNNLAEKANNALGAIDRSYLESKAKQDIAEITAKEVSGVQLSPEEVSHRARLADSVDVLTDNGTGQAGVNYGAIASKTGYVAGEAQTKESQAVNNIASLLGQNEATTQAETTQAGTVEGVEPTAQPTTSPTARAGTLEANGITDANILQAITRTTPTAANVPAGTSGTVPDSGLMPTARSEPALQPQPKVVQSAPQAIPKPGLTPQQSKEIDVANEQQLEALYQQDVKESINQRLGRAPKIKESKSSPFRSFLREHGISSSVASDVTGERGIRANNRLPATFRKNGLNLDLLAERAVESGFMSKAELESANDNGGANRLVQMIQAEMNGEKQLPIGQQNEDNAATSERVQRMEIEDLADSLGLPYKADISTDRLASMVKRVNDRLEVENLKSWGETKDGKPLGKLKEERVLENARQTAARYEKKRVQYERDLDWYAKDNIRVQDAVLDVSLDEDGLPVITKVSDIDAVTAWLQENKDWNNDYGTNTETDRDTRQAETPESKREGESTSAPESRRDEQQRGSSEEQVQEGLTSPTREDVLAKEERAKQVEKDKQADDKAKEKASKEAVDKKEIASRQEASAENYQLGQSAEDSLSGQKSVFDERFSPAEDSPPEYSSKELTSAGDITITIKTDDGDAKMTLNAKKYLASIDERTEALNEVKRCLG